MAGASGGPEYATQYAAWSRDLAAVLVDRMKIERAHLKVLTDTPDAGGGVPLPQTSASFSTPCAAR